MSRCYIIDNPVGELGLTSWYALKTYPHESNVNEATKDGFLFEIRMHKPVPNFKQQEIYIKSVSSCTIIPKLTNGNEERQIICNLN